MMATTEGVAEFIELVSRVGFAEVLRMCATECEVQINLDDGDASRCERLLALRLHLDDMARSERRRAL